MDLILLDDLILIFFGERHGDALSKWREPRKAFPWWDALWPFQVNVESE
jgi:hypothetical protein